MAVCVGAVLGALAPWGAFAQGAPGSCEREAASVSSEKAGRFLVLAAANGVFHNGSGPSFVMLMNAGATTEEPEMGAVGIYADDAGRAVFGAVPWQVYDAFLHEPERGSRGVMLRMQISEPQYERIRGVLSVWARRARESQLLYPDNLYMNNILLVKQATEELNRCTQTAHLYKLDWGIDDLISDNNASSRVPFLVFEELKRRNESLHVPDRSMPERLALLAGSEPLPARQPDPAQETVVRNPAPAHQHHMHHHAPADAAH
jgi:hypothetical protein